jgi:hypothetical protein
MAAANQLFGQIGDNTFRTAVKFRRYAFVKRRYLSDPKPSLWSQKARRKLFFSSCYAHTTKTFQKQNKD